jgi:hypothetical protein
VEQTVVFMRQLHLKQTRKLTMLIVELLIISMSAVLLGMLIGPTITLEDKSFFQNATLMMLPFGVYFIVSFEYMYGSAACCTMVKLLLLL